MFFIKYILIVLAIVLLNISEISFSQNSVTVLGEKELNNLIKERKGKFLLINVWATWCIPCREELPDLIKIADKFKHKVDIVGISVDYPDEIDSKIIPLIKSNKINFPMYVNGIMKPDTFINLFEKEWNGAIPATFLYNDNGEQVNKVFDKKDFDFFYRLITESLK